MRIALEVPAVLERARLAFVDVHRHQARLGLGGDDAPLAPGREAGAAQAAQRRVLHDLGDLLARAPAREAVGDQPVAALLAVGVVIDVLRCRTARSASSPTASRTLIDGRVAAPDSGRPPPPARTRSVRRRARAARARPCRGCRGSFSSSSPAPAISQESESHTRTVSAGGACFAFLHHVEVVVEGRDLVDLGLRQPHLLAPARRGARPTDGRSGPGSCAGVRSAGRGGAARRPAARDLLARRGIDAAALQRAARPAALRDFHRPHSTFRCRRGRLDSGQDSARAALLSARTTGEPG